MKKIFLYFLLSLSCIGSTYADFQDAMDAFDKGDFETAVQEWIPLAEDGNAEAQYRLGRAYYSGQGITKNDKLAFEWSLKAAEQGFARAQFNVGMFYRDGIGVDIRFEEAFRWVKKAAEQGFARAQFNVGMFYRDGTGVDIRFEEAVRWFKKAARQGDVGSQVFLGWSYSLGDGVATNPKFAYYWMMKAANQGDACAHWNIAYMYVEGLYLKQDINQTYFWGKQAVDKGCEIAILELKKITDYIGDKLPKIEPISYRINFDAIPEQEILLINKANLNGDKKYKSSSLKDLSCKSYLVVTKGGALNIKKKESITTNNLVSSYSQGFTEVTNQRYFDLQSKIRKARYDLQDAKDMEAVGYNSLTAFFSGVLQGALEIKIKDKIQALENELRNTSTTTRTQNKAPYNITQDSVVWEKTQQAKWMLINCISGEVEINELNASDILKINFYKGLRSDDINSFASSNIKAKNKLKNWSKESILSLYNTNKLDNKLLSKSSTEIDTASLVSLVETFLSTQ